MDRKSAEELVAITKTYYCQTEKYFRNHRLALGRTFYDLLRAGPRVRPGRLADG